MQLLIHSLLSLHMQLSFTSQMYFCIILPWLNEFECPPSRTSTTFHLFIFFPFIDRTISHNTSHTQLRLCCYHQQLAMLCRMQPESSSLQEVFFTHVFSNIFSIYPLISKLLTPNHHFADSTTPYMHSVHSLEDQSCHCNLSC